MGEFVPAGSGGLENAAGVAFGPDGNLYVASANTSQILRYHGQTGASMDVFISQGPGGLVAAPGLGLLFHTDGLVYVTHGGNFNKVSRYNASTGAFVDVLASGHPQDGVGGIAIARTGEVYISIQGLADPPLAGARLAEPPTGCQAPLGNPRPRSSASPIEAELRTTVVPSGAWDREKSANLDWFFSHLGREGNADVQGSVNGADFGPPEQGDQPPGVAKGVSCRLVAREALQGPFRR